MRWTPIWGTLGIYDCSSTLRAKGIAIAAEERVYAANHCRAILDMVHNAIKHKEYPHHITVDNWLDVDSELKRFFENIPVLNNFLEDDEKIILNSWLVAHIEIWPFSTRIGAEPQDRLTGAKADRPGLQRAL